MNARRARLVVPRAGESATLLKPGREPDRRQRERRRATILPSARSRRPRNRDIRASQTAHSSHQATCAFKRAASSRAGSPSHAFEARMRARKCDSGGEAAGRGSPEADARLRTGAMGILPRWL